MAGINNRIFTSFLFFSITGVFMNHREFFSYVDVSRSKLPKEFRYQNWNNGALKGNLILNLDSILVYGNIGIWLTDSDFKDYSSFNNGFPKGSDNRKIFDLHRARDGNLYAATQFGLYAFDKENNQWKNFRLNVDIKRKNQIGLIHQLLLKHWMFGKS